MEKSHLILVTSVKEGWGMIVTEANSRGTPAVVYKSDGLVDSVRNNITGWVSNENTPSDLARSIVLALEDPIKYEIVREAAWEWSKEFTPERTYSAFLKAIN